jgi:hypothetical protein
LLSDTHRNVTNSIVNVVFIFHLRDQNAEKIRESFSNVNQMLNSCVTNIF